MRVEDTAGLVMLYRVPRPIFRSKAIFIFAFLRGLGEIGVQ